MSEKDKFGQPKLTLGELGIKAMITELGQHQTKMFGMFFFGLGEDKNIIDVDHDELIKILHEHRVHKPHKSCWGICKTKRHNCILVKTIASDKSCLRNVFLPDLYLMVSRFQVHLGEDSCTRQLIKQIIYPRQRIFVIDGHGVQWSIIDNQTGNFGILLLNEEYRTTPSRTAGLNEVLG